MAKDPTREDAGIITGLARESSYGGYLALGVLIDVRTQLGSV
jgi:hypothetical protein